MLELKHPKFYAIFVFSRKNKKCFNLYNFSYVEHVIMLASPETKGFLYRVNINSL